MWSLFVWRYMNIHGIYFGKDEIYNMIRSEGGVWNRYSQKQQVIKNKKLISELERKLFRILSDENANPNKYRQHITDIKNKLIEELDS